ncbi:hypothetical protein D3C71_2092820 [compost metagenome]
MRASRILARSLVAWLAMTSADWLRSGRSAQGLSRMNMLPEFWLPLLPAIEFTRSTSGLARK